MDEHTETFERSRNLLEGLAYRMLGSLAEAQDVVQDTYLKWRTVTPSEIRDGRAWLVTVCSRLAINALGSARAQREEYVGTWLPEPFLDEGGQLPGVELEVDESVSLALLFALERLAPTERAAYLLHDVFGYAFGEVAEILGRSNAACRKLASRARGRLRTGPRRFEASADDHRRLVTAFLGACRNGELTRLRGLLSESIELCGDGGGKATAAGHLRGRDEVVDFLARIWSTYSEEGTEVDVELHWINGAPGALLFENGRLTTAICLHIANGTIERVFAQRNPAKLAVVAR
ncbi:MAG: RNA polymerase sigma factor SigJ [Thermoanaerobaculia bacterium]|nr:RNA polymerase sigma factor SigJ [Thermoanaerobaculia bacterium]